MRIKFTEQHHQEIADLFTINEEDWDAAEDAFVKNVKHGIIPRYLYLIKIVEQNFYKIGITNDLQKRLNQLQTGNPFIMNYVFAVEADLSDSFGLEIRYLERFLHKNFESKKVNNEWFELSKMDVCKIFLFLNSTIYSRDLYDVIPGTSSLRDVIDNCI